MFVFVLFNVLYLKMDIFLWISYLLFLSVGAGCSQLLSDMQAFKVKSSYEDKLQSNLYAIWRLPMASRDSYIVYFFSLFFFFFE